MGWEQGLRIARDILLGTLIVTALLYIFSNIFNFSFFAFGPRIIKTSTQIKLDAIIEIKELTTAEYLGENLCVEKFQSFAADTNKDISYELTKLREVYDELRVVILKIVKDYNVENFDERLDLIETIFIQEHEKKLKSKYDGSYYLFFAGDEELNRQVFKNPRKRRNVLLKWVYENDWEKAFTEINEFRPIVVDKAIRNVEGYRESIGKDVKSMFIGRGIIQAGLKLPDTTPRIEPQGYILINGKIEILDRIINPWLVPDKVKGFTALKIKNEKPILSRIIKTKTNCEFGLEADAISNGVKYRALENAEILLNELYNGPEKVILIDNDYMELKYEQISKDGYLNQVEFDEFKLLVDKWEKEENHDLVRYKGFQDQLVALPFLGHR